MNPYQVLGVSQTADEDTIKKAYRKAAKECHPDTHPGDKRAEERFKEIGEAYRILSDKQKREEYNARAAQKEQKSAAGRNSAGTCRNGAGTGRKNTGGGTAAMSPLFFARFSRSAKLRFFFVFITVVLFLLI